MEEKSEEKLDEKKGVFAADQVMINGPRADGNFRVSFDVGSYQYDNIKNLPKLNGKMLVVAVVQGEEFDKQKKETPKETQDMPGIEKL